MASSWLSALDNVEQLVARSVTQAASAVVESTSEFPKPASPRGQRAAKGLVLPYSSSQVASRAKRAEASWESFDWQEQQVHWQAALEQLQQGAPGLSPAQLQQQLHELYEQLLSLPDPLPALNSAAALSAKAAELEETNRSLQQQVANLQQDQAEVSQLLEDYRKEQAAHAALQAAHAGLQEELAAAQAASGSSQQLERQVQEQSSTIAGLQAALASLRTEYEASQSALFEASAREELAAGSASTAEQLAVDELERLSAELTLARKERALLQCRLQQLEQAQQGQQAAEAGSAVRSSQEGSGSTEPADSAAVDATRHARLSLATGGSLSAAAAEAQLAAAQAALEAAEEALRDQQHQVALLTTKLAAADSRLERLTAELQRRPAASAVAAMAEQLSALSALLGRQLESEGWDAEAAAAAVAAAVASPLEQLEPLLQERCSKLEQALQAAKAEASASGQAAADTGSRAAQLQLQLEEAQALNKQLEADLLAVSSRSAAAGDALSASGALDDDGLLAGLGLQHGTDGSSAAGTGDGSAGLGAAGSRSLDEDGSASAVVLTAVTAQRDRFKARLAELESGQAGLAAQLQEARAKADAVTADNVALVEKIRFLERYKQQLQPGAGGGGAQGQVTVIRVDGAGVLLHDDASGGGGGGGGGPHAGAAGSKAGRYRCGPLSLELPGGGGGGGSGRPPAGGRRRPARRQAGCFGMMDGAAAEAGLSAEDKYMQQYEAKLNPWSEFQASESEATLRSMQLHDKALLAGSRLIAGSRLARAGIAVYVLLLHGVIMALMYYSATPHAVLYEVSEGAGAAPPGVLAAAAGGNATAAAAGDAGAAAAGRLLLWGLRPLRL